MKAWRLLVPLLSLLAVALLTWWDVSRSQASPGPLHPAHAAVEALQGGANCAGCHRDGAVAATACMACHEAIRAQLADGVGLHGRRADAADCARCHSDHHGDRLPLLPPHAFARAGIDDVRAYDHRDVAFELHGAHAKLDCTACHQHAFADHPPANGRFVGLSQTCANCHRDVHQGAFGSDCARCHRQQGTFADGVQLAHGRFPLVAAHAELQCDACHQPTGATSVAERLQSAAPHPRRCVDCHADPHAGDAALAFDDTADCARCHQPTTWSAARPTTAAHAALGFPLRGAHAAAECRSCHGGGDAARWTGPHAPSLADCGGCHQQAHGAELLATVAEREHACAACHDDGDATFGDGRITPARHATVSGFAVDGPHAAVACAACHTGDAYGDRYPGGRDARDCRTCHQDAHGGQFGEDAQLRRCTSCHDVHGFRPHRFGVEAHAEVWPLAGAHDAVACRRCHDRVVDGVRRFVGTDRQCSACHEDVHEGRFDDRSHASAAGPNGCARCHDTVDFRRLATPFAHATWTGHALDGAHATLDCAACHPRTDTGRLGAAAGRACADCHRDPHLGQFQRDGAVDCRRCHASTKWSQLHFEHDRDSRFALDDTHARLACSKCHVEVVGANGAAAVRYRPLGRRCGDCHRAGGHQAAPERRWRPR